MDHPPYIPDLAPCEFWLFPKFKNMHWRGKYLLAFLTFNATWQRYCQIFRKTIFNTVSDSGTIVSGSAQLHKESISKVTQPLVLTQVNFVFTGTGRELNCRTTYTCCLFVLYWFHLLICLFRIACCWFTVKRRPLLWLTARNVNTNIWAHHAGA
jgi:hypothetical protein